MKKGENSGSWHERTKLRKVTATPWCGLDASLTMFSPHRPSGTKVFLNLSSPSLLIMWDQGRMSLSTDAVLL